jgi:hypothetical protein
MECIRLREISSASSANAASNGFGAEVSQQNRTSQSLTFVIVVVDVVVICHPLGHNTGAKRQNTSGDRG